MSEHTRLGHWITCACGKRGYHTKRDARAARKQLRDNSRTVYACEDAGVTLWHIGRRPYLVQRGAVARGDYYGRS
jgi:hypothetical protein